MADSIVLKDTFTRFVTNSWDRSDNGTIWQITQGTPADFDVDGSRGTIALPDTVTHRLTFPGSYKNPQFFATVRPNQVATGDAFVYSMQFRFIDDSNYLAMQVEFFPTFVSATLYVIKPSVSPVLGTVNKGAYTANSDWNVRVELVDATYRVKLWAATASEPTAWDVSVTQTHLPNAGGIAVRASRAAANTNTGLVCSIDNILITTVIPTVQIIPQFLNDYEFKFGHDGIVLNNDGPVPLPGKPLWDIEKLTGLDLPDIKKSDKEFDGIDGGILEATNISMRTIRMDGILYAHPDDDLELYLDQLKTNFTPIPRGLFTAAGTLSTPLSLTFDANERPFFIKSPGVDERFILAQPVACTYDWDSNRRFSSTSFQVILQAQVPTLYSPELHHTSCTLTGTLATPTDVSVYNKGNYYGYMVIAMSGLVSPTIIHILHVETGQELVLNIITAILGRAVEVNFRRRTVLILDPVQNVNVREQVTSEGWIRLLPKFNTVRISTNAGVTVTTDVLWRDEWF